MGDLIVVAANLDSKRMASGIIGNDVPRKGLRVRVSCYARPAFFMPQSVGRVFQLAENLGSPSDLDPRPTDQVRPAGW